MTDQSHDIWRLNRICARLSGISLDSDDLSEEEELELQELLEKSASNREYYCTYLGIVARLERRGVPLVDSYNDRDSSSNSELDPLVRATVLSMSNSIDSPIIQSRFCDLREEILNATDVSVDAESANQSSTGPFSPSSSHSGATVPWRKSKRASVVIIVISVLTAAAVHFWLFLSVHRSFTEPDRGSADFVAPEFLARVVQTNNCVWTDGMGTGLGQFLTASRLSLESGKAEFLFKSGSRITITGPTVLRVVGKTQVRLDQGRLWGKIAKNSGGFVVESQRGIVRDLSTEFEVEVNAIGDLEAEVIEGAIEVISNGIAGDAKTLAVGERVRIGSDYAVALISPRSDLSEKYGESQTGLTDSSSGQRVSQVMAPVGVSASSFYTPDSRRPEHTIDGSGLSGIGSILDQRHSGIPSPVYRDGAGMWLANTAKADITFDLGQSQTIMAMHLWNYGEYAHFAETDNTHRGVRGFRILAGEDRDNLTFIANASIPKATASGVHKDFSAGMDFTGAFIIRPETIVFRKPVDARFISLEIESNWGAHEYVGLSEVRFTVESKSTKSEASANSKPVDVAD